MTNADTDTGKEKLLLTANRVKTGTATMKINTEFPPKAENRAAHMIRRNYFGVYTKRTLYLTTKIFVQTSSLFL